MTIFGLICCWFADYLREREIATTTTVRKLFVTIGKEMLSVFRLVKVSVGFNSSAFLLAHFASAAFLVGMAYSGCDRVLTVILLTISVGLNGAGNASFQINHVRRLLDLQLLLLSSILPTCLNFLTLKKKLLLNRLTLLRIMPVL